MLKGWLAVLLAGTTAALAGEPGSIPIIYTTDLYHPHDDPDDHYDLLTLFALPEFDIRAIVIDLGERGKDRPAGPALRQVMHMTGRTAPWATGLVGNLASPEDTAPGRGEAEEQGVRLILDTLAAAAEPVTVFTAGSLRDVAAAFNRSPGLFREKVKRLYVNAGAAGGLVEWSADLDSHAFVRIMSSGLPVFWAPCFGESGYGTYWQFRQGDILEDAPGPVRNYLLFMFKKEDPEHIDPVAYLSRAHDVEFESRVWAETRNMWCTAPLLHAAGREGRTWSFVERGVLVAQDGRTTLSEAGAAQRMPVFRVTDEAAYPGAMREVLAGALRRVTAPGPANLRD